LRPPPEAATGSRYTGRVKTFEWRPEEDAPRQLESWSDAASEPGVVRAVFVAGPQGDALPWRLIEPWTRSRAVTIAEVRSTLASPALDVALAADLVYVLEEAELVLGDGAPSAGVLWALGRAGRAALARGLLDPGAIGAEEAVRLGLTQGVLRAGDAAPVCDRRSLTALTGARDLMRSNGGAVAGLQLELATFRLLFAAGDPAEGARAFLERRAPVFNPREKQ
jgi:enoyl-CoA hydratase/carnithine racemase